MHPLKDHDKVFISKFLEMVKQMKEADWNPEDFCLTKPRMDERIKTCTSYRGWQYTIKLLIQREIPFNQLKVAEVGCGTGTFSLTLGLLGASVTLIDFNQKVLEKEVYVLNHLKSNLRRYRCVI